MRAVVVACAMLAGRAIVFEAGGLRFDPKVSLKTLAPWTKNPDNGMNGDPTYYLEKLLPLCAPFKAFSTEGEAL